MDADRFDALTRFLASATTTRRTAFKGLVGGTLGAFAAALGVVDAGATHWGCRHVGKECSRDRQCCSHRCWGPKGNETCRAHHEGSCTAAKDFCVSGRPGCGGGACTCFRTTGGANYCTGGGPCMACATDRECEVVTGVPGSACIDIDHANCNPSCGFSTACAVPCTA